MKCEAKLGYAPQSFLKRGEELATELLCSLCSETFMTEDDDGAAEALANQQACTDDEYWIVCPNCDASYSLEKRTLNPILSLDSEMNLTKILTIREEGEPHTQ